jgi:hypothetical protein
MNRSRASAPARQRGAALLLLLMVLGLGAASVMINIFAKPSSVLRQQARTARALAEAKEALLGYAILHRRLPRPAVSTLDGSESQQPCTSEESCTGLLPWITLGLTPGDGWNKLLRYSVTPAYANGTLDKPAEATKTVLDRGNDGTLLFRAGSANCFVDDRCPPAVIYSSGKHLGISVDGLPQTSAVTDNTDEQANEEAVKDFMARAATDDIASIGGSFSAATAWVPLAMLRARIRSSAPTAQR